MANARKLTVVIAGDTKGLSSAIGQADSALSSFGSKALPILGGITAGLGALAAIGIGLVSTAYDLGASFDDAFDTIQVATGATGSELEGLKDTFRDVFSEVPASMGDVATAVGQLNTRLDLTGDSLAAASEQLLDFTRLTKADTAAAINLVTRLMGDWSVANEDIGLTMDKLFVAQQETGVGWETLAEQVVQFGAPLRQLGFDLDTSIALLAKFNAEGVNTELVMGSMRIALARLSKAETEETSTVRSSTVDRKAQARAIADAQRAIEDAAEGVLDANERVIESQKELDELLRGPSSDDKEEARLDEAEADAALAAAAEQLADAQQELAAAQEEGDPVKVRKATLALENAQVSLTRAQQRARKAVQELTQVNTWSAETDKKVAEARKKVEDAHKSVADAEDRAVQAQERLIDAQTRSVGASSAASAESGLLADTIKRLGLDGATTQEQYEGLVKEIKDSKDPVEATRLGMELFGSRAGADMVAAIREGRFEGLAPLVADLEGAAGTVGDTATDTEDFSERFQIAMNNLKLAVEPIVEDIFGWFSDDLAPAIQRVADAFSEGGLGGALSELEEIWKEHWPAIKREITEAIGELIQWLIDHADDFAKAFFEFGKAMGNAMAQGIVAAIAENVPGAEKLLGKGHVLEDWQKNHPTGSHTGGTFRAPTPGGEGWAWLRDGERVTTPGQNSGMGAPVVIVKLDNSVLASGQARFDKRNVATVVVG